jgi:hypothetical protein
MPIYPSSKLPSVFGFRKKSPFLKPTSIELVTVGNGLTGYIIPEDVKVTPGANTASVVPHVKPQFIFHLKVAELPLPIGFEYQTTEFPSLGNV